jgi:beta-carotene ketolase (CrtO type)
MQHVKSAYGAASGKITEHPFGKLSGEELRVVLSSAESVITEHLSHPSLQAAALAYSTHPEMPPWTPGSGALGCLLASSHGTQSCRPVGGTGKLIEALTDALSAAGGRLRCHEPVSKIRTTGDRVVGVDLSDGTFLEANTVVSSIDVKRVVSLLDSSAAPPELNRVSARAHTGIFNVGEMKLDLALDRPPQMIGLSDRHAGSLYYLQEDPKHYGRAMQTIFAGGLPDPLPMMAAVPSVEDPSLAPSGQAVLWLSAFVPARWSDGSTWPQANLRVQEVMLNSFERFAPGTKERVVGIQATGPGEWETRTGNLAGNPNHLDMTLDQLFTLRPGPGLSNYRTPIRGLYLSGAGTHPGGGVHGVPGFLAAQAVISDSRAHG